MLDQWKRLKTLMKSVFRTTTGAASREKSVIGIRGPASDVVHLAKSQLSTGPMGDVYLSVSDLVARRLI